MYVPSHFKEDRVEVLHGLVRQHTLATLVTLGAEGLIANHIPMVLDPEPAPLGTLRGHVSRANGQWRDSRSDVDALAVFQGPAAYVSPSWNPVKVESGRVVPTYNYVVVHAHGALVVHDDPAWLEAHLRALTSLHEAPFPEPWTVDDAPADYIQNLLPGIVGIEVPISRLEGKWKVSQNRSPREREGLARGLRSAAHDVMAALVDAGPRDPRASPHGVKG